MKHPVRILLIAIASFYLGWLANGHFAQVDDPSPLTALQTTLPEASTDTRAVPPSPVEAQSTASYSIQFRQLLTSQAYEEAMLLYEQAAETDEQQLQSMHTDLLTFLRTALERGNNESLMALADAWLSQYYDDIDVLMILAEYQRRQGYPDEAARVFQFAFTYALQPGQQEKVSTHFRSLVEDTDAVFSQQQHWVELLGFYELLQTIGLSQPEYRLRQATVYLELQDFSSARALLIPLTENVAWAGKARELLSAMEPQAEEVPEEQPRGDIVPLRRRGSHYLVQVSLNGVSDVTLMIDTGASITSLSRDAFKTLSKQSRFDYLGWHLFNTANGVTRGNIYRAYQLRLGDHDLQDVDIAVLDFRQDKDVDGLLGMNVLQHFRFEIDQDQNVLYLQAR